MVDRVDRVTIVGGGTAGWLTATALASFLNDHSDGPPVRITLIESPGIPTIGVGEATVPGMPRLLRQLRINEDEFFRRTNASFKLGVRFVDWSRRPDGRPLTFTHPFNTAQPTAGFDPAYHYHRFGPPDDTADIADALVPNGAVIGAMRGPRRLEDGQYQQAIGYSYHLDAALFAAFLHDVATTRGVEHVLDDVTGIERDERGFIAHLSLARGGRHPVQLVIDCTGFRGSVIQEAMGEPFRSFSDCLLCDSALAVQLPHLDPTRLEPCTRSTALGAGWAWRVPLFSRVGTGYVYSSAFRSDDEAIAEFLAYLESQGHSTDGVEPRVLRMRIGRIERSWVNNCVAIGLSGGFIEPLESTAIYAIEMAVRWLVDHWPDSAVSAPLANRFNQLMAGLYAELRDFIALHYVTSNREDPFWRAARQDIVVPDHLREALTLWRHTLPSHQDTMANHLFIHWSHIFVLGAKGWFDGITFPLEGSISRAGWERYSQGLAETKRRLVQDLPDHHELLTHIRGDEAQEAAPAEAQLIPRGALLRATVPLPE